MSKTTDYISREDVLDKIDYIRDKYTKQPNRRNKVDQFWADTLRYLERAVRNCKSTELVDIKTLTPCDVCAYNPPSSFGQKPCFICGAQARDWGEEEK